MAITKSGATTRWQFMLDSVRKVEYFKEQVYAKSVVFLGEPNDATTRKTIQLSLSSFFKEAMDQRMISSYSVTVALGTDPRSINITAGVQLINETDYITFNLELRI